MPFEFDKLVDAVVHSVGTSNDLDNGPTTPEFFPQICQYMGVRKNQVRRLRASLDFLWRKNEKTFCDIVKDRLLCKSFSDSLKLTPTESDPKESSCSETKDVRNENRNMSQKSRKKFLRLVGVMKIKTSRISERGKVCPDRFHRQIRQKMPYSGMKASCTLVFDGFKNSKNAQTPIKFWDYAHCRQPNCRGRYKFVASEKDHKYTYVLVYVIRQNKQKHTLPLNYQLRGRQRKKVEARLEHEMLSRIHAKQHKAIDERLTRTGKNYMFRHSLGVYQTARYNGLRKKDKDSDDTLDIIKRMLTNDAHEDAFIRRFITPFTMYLGCTEQIQFLKENPGLVFHFDATSSIIRKPYPQSKRVYLYSGVIEKAHKILALLHMVSNDQRAVTIRDLLVFFRELWTSAGIQWPPFEAVVVDWSWASINAILSAWNNTDISQYLVAAYKNVTEGTAMNLLPIHLCYGHFMKMISTFLRKNQVDGVRKKVIMEGMAVLCHCKSLIYLRRKVTYLVTILLSEKESAKIHSAMKKLIRAVITDKISEVEDISFNNESSDDALFVQFDCETDKKCPAYASSPFFVYFDALVSKIETSINYKSSNEAAKNTYLCRCFVLYLKKSLLPYAPLWTGLIITKQTTGHYSNAIAENHFKIVKESVCEKQINAKASRVIDKLHEHALSTAKELTLGPSSQHINCKKRKCESVNESGVDKTDDCKYDINSKVPKTDGRPVIHYKVNTIESTVIQSPIKTRGTRKDLEPKRRINAPGNMNSAEYWRRKRQARKSRQKYQQCSTLKSITRGTPENNFESNSCNEIYYNPNGTVANKKYYYAPHLIPIREYFVGVVPKSPEERDYYRYLRGEDYVTLFEKTWITNTVIDYCYSWWTFEPVCNSNSNRFAYVAVEVSSKFIGKGELADMCDEFKAKCKRDWAGKDRLLFPMNVHGQHFILMYVDIAARITYLLDPAMKSGSSYHTMCHTNFIEMWWLIFGTDYYFARGTCKYPYQADGYNCGIFVIHYIQQILSKDDLEIDPVKPDELRIRLQHDCVVKSADVRERCLRCGCTETRRQETWVGCDCCQKWTHLSCLHHLNKTQKEIEHSSYKYICDLCANWINSP